MADGIFTADECGIIQSLNPAMETLFDYRQADLIGQPITVLLGEEDCSYYVDLFNHSHRVTFPNRRHKVQGITRTGASVPLRHRPQSYQAGRNLALSRHDL
ncbi:MAG UNVERIFIED_CONTAM: PAS domain S-box protein [Anaerolineae bacterium]